MKGHILTFSGTWTWHTDLALGPGTWTWLWDLALGPGSGTWSQDPCPKILRPGIWTWHLDLALGPVPDPPVPDPQILALGPVPRSSLARDRDVGETNGRHQARPLPIPALLVTNELNLLQHLIEIASHRDATNRLDSFPVLA